MRINSIVINISVIVSLFATFSFGSIPKRLVYKRSLGEDDSLPFPLSIHELGQHKFRRSEHGDMNHRSDSATRKLAPISTEIVPLYPGYGTHYAFIYVGTPPQRQSVIVDTGSHFTAFPCSGCSQCGQHTDPYWDLANSTTAKVPQCNNQVCVISQSYSEGSSWRAYKVIDKLWVGGLGTSSVMAAEMYKINFTFGCQTSETGLFRTQLADGIMGMSIADDTLPFQLRKQGMTTSRIFSLCYRVGGGIFTVGGVDQRIHLRSGVTNYAKMNPNQGWYAVTLLDIMLQDQRSLLKKSLDQSPQIYAKGKGTIVDSGTTDTYLPSAVAAKFNEIFRQISGVAYSGTNIELTKEQLSKMPNLIFVLQGLNSNITFQVEMPWTSYVDAVGGNKYAFRIYLSEAEGVILGSNFMNGYNVIFDVDGSRVGFAKSNCVYEDFAIPVTPLPSSAPTQNAAYVGQPPSSSAPSNGTEKCVSRLVPLGQCSAFCDPLGSAKIPHIAEGNQSWTNRCETSMAGEGSRLCHIPCVGSKVVRGNPFCPDTAWSECSKACIQARKIPASARAMRRLARERAGVDPDAETDVLAVVSTRRRLSDAAEGCKQQQQTRVCYTGACPVTDGDYLIFIDLRVRIPPDEWSYVHSEAFFAAFAKLFKVKESYIELLNDAGSELSIGTKLHFQIRLRSKEFASVMAIHKVAQSIPQKVWSSSFQSDLLDALTEVSAKMDQIDYSRYGYLFKEDIEVLNSMAIPIGDVRDPVEIPNVGGPTITEPDTVANARFKVDLLLAGVAIASVLIMLCVLCLYYRLRREHAALEKDKVMGGSLRRMWDRFMRLEQQKHGKSPTTGDYAYAKVQMSDFSAAVESGVLTARDDELELEGSDGK